MTPYNEKEARKKKKCCFNCDHTFRAAEHHPVGVDRHCVIVLVEESCRSRQVLDKDAALLRQSELVCNVFI